MDTGMGRRGNTAISVGVIAIMIGIATMVFGSFWIGLAVAVTGLVGLAVAGLGRGRLA